MIILLIVIILIDTNFFKLRLIYSSPVSQVSIICLYTCNTLDIPITFDSVIFITITFNSVILRLTLMSNFYLHLQLIAVFIIFSQIFFILFIKPGEIRQK